MLIADSLALVALASLSVTIALYTSATDCAWEILSLKALVLPSVVKAFFILLALSLTLLDCQLGVCRDFL